MMNKQQLVDKISTRTGISKTKVLNVLDHFVDSVQGALKKGNKVQLVGFGQWKKVRRKAKVGRDPRSGKSIPIPPRNVAKFTMGSELNDLLN